MRPMGDGLAVLGARHGIMLEPTTHQAHLIKFGRHPGILFGLETGVEVAGNKYVFPFATMPESQGFDFLDQDIGPTTMMFTGIIKDYGLKVTLTLEIPFLPRDLDFSSVPVFYISMQVKRMRGNYRWNSQSSDDVVNGHMFLRLNGDTLVLSPCEKGCKITLNAPVLRKKEASFNSPTHEEMQRVEDYLGVIQGQVEGGEFTQDFHLIKGQESSSLLLAWCGYSPDIFITSKGLASFYYKERFSHVHEVFEWASHNYNKVHCIGENIRQLWQHHSLGVFVTNLMNWTFHSWLINTWLVREPDNQVVFTVWEGNCYFNSTVDVEFTQLPFYMQIWPELLGLELEFWTRFGNKASSYFPGRQDGEIFLSHDTGEFAQATTQHYHHHMEVEESANYLIMAYAYYSRTGDVDSLSRWSSFCEGLTSFLKNCDTTGNGLPNEGCSNTLDDASMAVQFGKEQVYLGVKMASALTCAAKIKEALGQPAHKKLMELSQKAIKTIEETAFQEDHYIVTTTKVLDQVRHPWHNTVLDGPLLGFDAYHIYTENSLGILDAMGIDIGLNQEHVLLDLYHARQHTLQTYGCRHTSYLPDLTNEDVKAGLAGSSEKTGWISMNMLRDMAAMYRGLDFSRDAERYWSFQQLTNDRELCLFFETFAGNNLHFYPRGVAIFGYLEAAGGVSVTGGGQDIAIHPKIICQVPILCTADYVKGTCENMEAYLVNGVLTKNQSSIQLECCI